MLAVGSLALTGCGQKNQSNPNAGKGGGTTSKSAPLQDLNIKSRDEVKDGGTVRFSIETLPTTWNALHIDGNTVDLSTTIMGFVGANNFDIAEDGTPTDTSEFVDAILTGGVWRLREPDARAWSTAYRAAILGAAPLCLFLGHRCLHTSEGSTR